MPITRNGDWWNQNTRPLLKVKAGAVTADVEQDDVASCAVTSGSVALGAIKSEHATSGLRRKTHTIIFDGASSTEAGGVAAVGTTALAVWQTPVALSIVGVDFFTLARYQNATCDIFTLYGNAGTSIGQVSLKAVAASTSLLRGVRVAATGLNMTALPAGADVLISANVSTCSEVGRTMFVIDYVTTG